ncbi:MAG: ATP-binding cassette domain-containing protein, partial [Muribaculaceae bacterium]|nr:ATP-binding cassette domain-containing protein [Muribaculaceae bacterium]
MLCEASGITKNFGDLRVLADVNLTISEGEVVAITGPSGAGKTTLLLTLGSLERPDSGIVRYEGEDIYRLGDAALAKFRNSHIGFVFQFHQLLPEFSLIENVA